MKTTTPFYPASSNGQNPHNSISIGLENGDLLFLGFFGAESCEEAFHTLQVVLKQALQPIHDILSEKCSLLNVHFNGKILS